MAFKLAKAEDVLEGCSLRVTGPAGEAIALFRIGGNIYALDNRCPHAGGPLAEGEIFDECITCPWHGWQFKIKTGESLDFPGIDARKIEIAIAGGYVVIEE